jgi:hypothetical protein
MSPADVMTGVVPLGEIALNATLRKPYRGRPTRRASSALSVQASHVGRQICPTVKFQIESRRSHVDYGLARSGRVLLFPAPSGKPREVQFNHQLTSASFTTSPVNASPAKARFPTPRRVSSPRPQRVLRCAQALRSRQGLDSARYGPLRRSALLCSHRARLPMQQSRAIFIDFVAASQSKIAVRPIK